MFPPISAQFRPEWRAMPDETGHWEVADDTIGRPPLFLIVFSFFSVGETSPGNKKPNG